jgi:hypothetical protein
MVPMMCLFWVCVDNSSDQGSGGPSGALPNELPAYRVIQPSLLRSIEDRRRSIEQMIIVKPLMRTRQRGLTSEMK